MTAYDTSATTSAAPSAAPKLRLFVAVEVPAQVRGAVDEACQDLRLRARDMRWTDPSSWHLTLAFLGWVQPQRVEVAEAAVAGAAAGSQPFAVALDGSAGMFGRRVVWAGLADSPPLAALAAHVQRGLRGAGFELEERDFHPHLTLARARRRSRAPRDLADVWSCPALPWEVRRVNLMRSRPGAGGARYSVHAAWSLGDGQLVEHA